MIDELRVFADKPRFGDQIELNFRIIKCLLQHQGKNHHPGCLQAYHGELVMKPIDEGVNGPPAARLNVVHAQALMDALWNCGLRPTEGAGSAGSLAATEKHLRDMRTIAFGLMGLGEGSKGDV